MNKSTGMTVTLLRRLAAICYDGMLLFSVLFVSTLLILPLVSNTAIESGNLAYNFYLLIMCYLYFCWQWMNGGQTLGMKSWRLQVVNSHGQTPNWRQASLRFLAALLSWLLLGLGFIWSLFDTEKLTLHDRLSATRLVLRHTP